MFSFLRDFGSLLGFIQQGKSLNIFFFAPLDFLFCPSLLSLLDLSQKLVSISLEPLMLNLGD
jgi:hypothetical protein